MVLRLSIVAQMVGARLAQAGLVALSVGLLTFLMVRNLPGDMAFRIAAGRYGYDNVDADAAAAVAQELGLNQPAWQALFSWLGDLLRLDLGTSLVSGRPVWQEVSHQLGHSLTLALAALILSLFIGPPLGVLAAMRPKGLIDRLVFGFSLFGRALPPFAIGLLLMVVFSVHLGWLPAAGYGKPSHYILPALTLAVGLAAVSAQVARRATLEVLQSGYVSFARTKGLPEGAVVRRHGVRNIAVPIATYLSVQLAYLVEGVVIIETLFAWPGIGHALVHAIFSRDVPMIQGTALVLGLGFVALRMGVDGLNSLIDGRKRELR